MTRCWRTHRCLIRSPSLSWRWKNHSGHADGRLVPGWRVWVDQLAVDQPEVYQQDQADPLAVEVAEGVHFASDAMADLQAFEEEEALDAAVQDWH